MIISLEIKTHHQAKAFNKRRIVINHKQKDWGFEYHKIVKSLLSYLNS